MTTTNVYQGYAESKPTSKVLAPPGGYGNDIFGTGGPSYNRQQNAGDAAGPRANETTATRLFGGDEAQAPAKASAPEAKVDAPAAGVNTHAGNSRDHVDLNSCEPEENAAVTHCRKRFFKNEGRDGESDEETEEERKKREAEEEEKKKKAQEATTSPSRAKPPRGAYNPITGEAYPDMPQGQQAQRQRQPPGGKSSGPLW